MNTQFPARWLPKVLGMLSVMLVAGCRDAPAQKKQVVAAVQRETEQPRDSEQDQAPARPLPGKTLGKNVSLEIDGDKRRVLVNAVVCLREGMLEQLLCRAGTKEHESILSADIDAKLVHAALTAAGAEAGSPVQFRPKYSAARGTVIKVHVQYEDKGKIVKVPAQKWVRTIKTRKELTHDWVFAGSMLLNNSFQPNAPPIYAANDGDVICVANFESAMLDLPISSSADNDDLDFEAFTERIPPEGTHVTVILEPVVPVKKN
jgi:hypothetical protein